VAEVMNPNMKLPQLKFLITGPAADSQDVAAISALILEDIKKDGRVTSSEDLSFSSFSLSNNIITMT